MPTKERVICAVCGKNCAGKVPKGGDGSILFPRKHMIDVFLQVDVKHNGSIITKTYTKTICYGSFQEGKIV